MKIKLTFIADVETFAEEGAAKELIVNSVLDSLPSLVDPDGEFIIINSWEIEEYR